MNKISNQKKQKKEPDNYFFGANPVINKVSKIEESSSNCAAYGSIAVKTIYFLLISAVGFVVYLLLATRVLNTGESFDISYDNYVATVHITPLFVGAGAIILSVILPFIVAFIPTTAAVLGTIYCLSQGALLGTLCYVAPQQYQGIMAIALLITILIVLTMLGLYASGIVRPGKKIRTAIMALFFTSVALSIVSVVLYLIPATRGIVSFFVDDPVFGVVCSLIGILLATLFLLCDFETIRQVVENNLPKKYEWSAAFGLAFTVIWLYFKILDLLAKLTNTKSS